jgi:hypothetical protein
VAVSGGKRGPKGKRDRELEILALTRDLDLDTDPSLSAAAARTSAALGAVCTAVALHVSGERPLDVGTFAALSDLVRALSEARVLLEDPGSVEVAMGPARR